jgi:signal transduction histidine kinase
MTPHEVPARGWLPNTADATIALIAAVFCVSGAAIVGASGSEPDLTPVGAMLLIAQCAPLAYRRRFPLAVWMITGVAVLAYGLADWPDPLLPLGAFIGLATVVECCRRRTALIAWLVTGVAATLVVALAGDSDAVDWWVVVVVLVFAPLLGDQQRNRTAYLAELQASAARAAQDHEREMRAAQLAERAHLARELHDVVAHHVSMIAVQAEAGASVAATAGTAPASEAQATTVSAFEAIANTARRTLAELRTLLGVLRTEQTPHAPTAPQAGIDQIEDLIRAVPAGVQIDLSIEGPRQPVPPAVDLSAYRVVQEGLTNVVKHANARRASVCIRYEPQALNVTISDDGSGDSPSGPPGHGLDGLRERVSLLHGTLTTCRPPSGGFLLDVSLPLTH